MSEMIYTHIAHGGAYTVVGVAKGAGKSKLIEPLTIYRDMTSGELYFRTAEDFNDIIRPAALAPIPEQVAQATILATWPERIWLQYGESEPETYPGAGSEITWCEDNINGAGDVEYVRADLATQSAKQATVAQEVTQQAAKASCIEGLMRYGIGRIGDLERMADGEAYLVADVERFLAPTTSTVSASGALAAADDVWNEALEAAAKMLLNGYFLHDQAPPKLFAGEAAKAIREMKRTAAQAATDKSED